MIRHIQNPVTHQAAARTAVRQPATATAETSPFRSVLATVATSPATASTTATAQPTVPTAPAETVNPFTAIITKSPSPTAATTTATPALPLAPPVFVQGITTTNPDGTTSPVNPTEFAAPFTAQQIAAKLGGVVDEGTIPGFSSTQLSIRVPGSTNLVNAGVAAQLFNMFGDKPGSQAWQIINRDLGRDPMST